MFKILTIEELAEDAFVKAEYVRNLGMANMPVDYEARKKAFVDLAVARAAAKEAEDRLTAAVNNSRRYNEPTLGDGPRPQ